MAYIVVIYQKTQQVKESLGFAPGATRIDRERHYLRELLKTPDNETRYGIIRKHKEIDPWIFRLK